MRIRFLIMAFMGVLLANMTLLAENPETRRSQSWIVCFKSAKPLPLRAPRGKVIEFLQNQCKENLQLLPVSFKITPLWIANAAAVKATAQEAARLATLPNVDRVVPDRYRQWIRPEVDWKPIPGSCDKGPVWSVQKVRAPEVWSEFKIDGAGVVVGHIDSGIYEAHPALKGKVLKFKDFSPDAKSEPYDDSGHGTHTAGSIVGGGGVGVAPGARLIVAKVFDKTGNAEDSWVLAAMQWVMDPDGNPQTNDGPLLISNSWGSNDITEKTFWNASRAWYSAGILPVFAAGNNGPSGNVATPGNFPHAWAVGATTKSDVLANFSSIGPSTWDGVTLVKPDISAPGHQVLSCSKTGTLVYNSGTSMACPHVAGLVALMLQAKPKMSILQIRSIAESTAVDLGGVGKDNLYGAGRFDAYACIKKVLGIANLAGNFKNYEEVLLAEKALIGVGPVSPLAAPLAVSLLQRAKSLDEGEFRDLAAQIGYDGPAGRLLAEVCRLRTAEALHQKND